MGVNDGDLLAPEGTGKVTQLMGILKQVIHVKDLAHIRLSLPANLLEPVGNLEYWTYADRADIFAGIGEAQSELEQMLGLVRWAFSKDIKFVHHKVMKPYNSILGEHFRAHWDVALPTVNKDTGDIELHQGIAQEGKHPPNPYNEPRASRKDIDHAVQRPPAGKDSARVVFLNEQTSHHPPVSYFVLEARLAGGKKVIASGADQFAASFTGTSLKVAAGEATKGIFVDIPHDKNAQFIIEHSPAIVSGLLKASPYVSYGGYSSISCTAYDGASPPKGTHLRTLIHYIDDPWIGKPKFLVEGVIYKADPTDKYTTLKQVPAAKIVARISGSWRDKIYYQETGSSKRVLLLDIQKLQVLLKNVRSLEEQDDLETQRVWGSVSEHLKSKNWSEANKAKHSVEQEQRDKAEARKNAGQGYRPVFFRPRHEPWDGHPVLTDTGRKAIDEEFTR